MAPVSCRPGIWVYIFQCLRFPPLVCLCSYECGRVNDRKHSKFLPTLLGMFRMQNVYVCVCVYFARDCKGEDEQRPKHPNPENGKLFLHLRVASGITKGRTEQHKPYGGREPVCAKSVGSRTIDRTDWMQQDGTAERLLPPAGRAYMQFSLHPPPAITGAFAFKPTSRAFRRRNNIQHAHDHSGTGTALNSALGRKDRGHPAPNVETTMGFCFFAFDFQPG